MRRLAHALIGVLIGALSGCAATVPALPSEPALPRSVELVETPFFPQEREQCGPAALATVLNYYGGTTSPETLREWVYIAARDGSLQAEMTATARRHDMVAYPLNKRLPALLQELAAAHPVLVLQNLGLSWLPRWHYAVAIGYDLERETLILRSGTERRWETPLGVFLNTWARAEYWALVIVPPAILPATADAPTWLRAAADLESTGRMETAYRAFITATVAFPGEPHAWLGKANTALHLARPDDAARDYARALSLKPDDAITWNNFAYALRDTRCTTASRAAIRCAASLAPNDERFAASKAELELATPHTNTTIADAESCPTLPQCPQNVADSATTQP